MSEQDRILGATADTVQAATNVVPMRLEGSTLSLNFTMRALFMIPEVGFCLNFSTPTARVPDNITDHHRQLILNAIRRGELLLDSKPVMKQPKRANALKAQIAILETPGIGTDMVINMVNGVVRMTDNDPKLGGHSRHQALEALFKVESENQARKMVLEHLVAAIDYVPGPSSVTDEPGQIVASPPGKPTGGASAARNIAETPSTEDIGSI